VTTMAITSPLAPGDTARTGHGQGMGYQYARLYLVSLCRGEARLNLHRALEATGICQSHKHGLTDSHRTWHWRGHVPIDITILAA
jgi:hypothetical protein